MVCFTAIADLAQSNIASLCDAAHGPWGVCTGGSNRTRTRALMMPLTVLMLRGYTYTELPLDVLPISFHPDWAATGDAAASRKQPKWRLRINTLWRATSSFDNRPYNVPFQGTRGLNVSAFATSQRNRRAGVR